MHLVCDEMSKPRDERQNSSASALAFGKVNAQLLEFAIQVGALQTCFVGHARHRAAFVGQVKFKVGFFKSITSIAQRLVEVKALRNLQDVVVTVAQAHVRGSCAA